VRLGFGMIIFGNEFGMVKRLVGLGETYGE